MAKEILDTQQRITLYVYPWAKKFLIEKKELRNDCVLTETTSTGLFLCSILMDKKKYCRHRKFKEGTIPMEIILPNTIVLQRNPVLTDEMNQRFNEYIKKLMMRIFFERIESAMMYSNKKMKEIINDLIDEYELEENKFSYAWIVQAYYRYRKSLND